MLIIIPNKLNKCFDVNLLKIQRTFRTQCNLLHDTNKKQSQFVLSTTTLTFIFTLILRLSNYFFWTIIFFKALVNRIILNSSVINWIWSVANVAFREIGPKAIAVGARRWIRQSLVVGVVDSVNKADSVTCQQLCRRLVCWMFVQIS